jgi:ribonuclease BN (tRNA processing enzyme)
MKTHEMIFIGAGSAFTMNNRQSNIIIRNLITKKCLLIDCGTDIRHSLQQSGVQYSDIDAIYISHLHADHAGGLECIAFSTYFNPSCGRPKMYLHKSLKNNIWSDTLRGGLASIQGNIAELDTYFDVQSTNNKGTFIWDDIEFQMIQTVHIMDGFNIVPSFGLIFILNKIKVFFTSDTQFCPEQIVDFYKGADIIFQDCETTPFESRVHAHYNKLNTLPTEIKRKMKLYHYQDGPLPDAVKDGFLGFVCKGEKVL